jgi:uncharacterized protein (TIGR03437 family)
MGEVVDPVGDSSLTGTPPNTVPPDIIAGSATVIGNTLRFRVRFAPGTFDQSTTLVTIPLDTDQNPATGSPGVNNDGSIDRTLIGADYMIQMGGQLFGNTATVLRYSGQPNTYVKVGTAPVVYFSNGMDTTVPLSLIGSAAGLLNFKIVSSLQTGPGSSSGIADIMPNVGIVPATTGCPANLTGPFAPQILSGGVLNGASFAETPVSPGEIVTIFTANAGPPTLAGLALNASGLVDTQVSGTRVTFDGIPAPIIYTQAGQISVVVPYEVTGNSTMLQVSYNGLTSNPTPLPVAQTAPGVFTVNASGSGPGAILNQDMSVNSTSNPASPGSIVVIYATGEGQTIPGGMNGKPAVDAVLPKPIANVGVTIGGQSAEIVYAGAAPSYLAGLMQINVKVPASVPIGNTVPILVQVGTVSSQAAVTLAIK